MIVMTCILLAAAATGLFLLRSSHERKQLKVEKYNIDNIHSPESGLRIAFISDVHDRLTASGIEEIAAAVMAEKPNLVILGGDIITFNRKKGLICDTRLAAELIEKLSAAGPVFYAEGNHELKFKEMLPSEYEAFTIECKSKGALILSDSRLTYKGVDFYCAALGQEYYRKMFPGIRGKQRMPQSYLIKKLGMPDTKKMNVLLMHSPMYLKEAGEWGADLVLSGHFHGGTIRLPLLGGLMTPQFQFFVKECAGVHKEKDCTMIANRGIGTHSVRLRINDLPELSIIDIRKSDGRADI